MSKKTPAADPAITPDPVGVPDTSTPDLFAPEQAAPEPSLEEQALVALRAGNMLEYRSLVEKHLAQSLGSVRGGIVQPE